MKRNHLIRIFLLSLLILTSIACSRKTIPDGIIDEKTMVSILTEAHLSESYYNIESNFHLKEIRPMMQATYDSIFMKHGVTRDDFDRSLDYYTRNEAQLEAIYLQVSDSLKAILNQ